MNEMNPLRRLRSVDAADTQADVMTGALREAGRGSEAAFRQFYEAASALVYGTVLRVVRDRAMAEEVAQEVFVELWRLAPRFDAGKGTARAWAATIAHRRAVDRVRSEQSRRDREDRENHATTIEYDSVSEQVDDSLERERVRQALIDLSDTQREAVTLAYYGGHTYREVAVLLDVAEGTAKTRIRDGLIKLRDTMGVTT